MFNRIFRTIIWNNEGVWDLDNMSHVLFLELDRMRTVAGFRRGKIHIFLHIEKLNFIFWKNYIYVGIQWTHHGREYHFFLFERLVGNIGSRYIFVTFMKNIIFQQKIALNLVLRTNWNDIFFASFIYTERYKVIHTFYFNSSMEEFAWCKLDNAPVFLIWNYGYQILIEITNEKSTWLVRICICAVLIIGDLNEFWLNLRAALQIEIPSDFGFYSLNLICECSETESIISVEDKNYIRPWHWRWFDILYR